MRGTKVIRETERHKREWGTRLQERMRETKVTWENEIHKGYTNEWGMKVAKERESQILQKSHKGYKRVTKVIKGVKKLQKRES